MPTKNAKIKILVAEDNEDDAKLLMRQLRKDRHGFDWKRVDSADDFLAALTSEPWDIIISDFMMPSFTGLDALHILQQSGLDIPFVIVSGTVGEDVAVRCMKAGANDYLMKDNLTRLGPVVEREIQEANERRQRVAAERALVETRANLAEAQRLAHIGNWVWDIQTNTIAWSDELFKIFGTTYKDSPNLPENPVIFKEDIHLRTDAIRMALDITNHYSVDFRIVRKDGSLRYVHDQGHVARDKTGHATKMFGTIQDITERKETELRLKDDEARYRAIVETFDGLVYICSRDYRIEFMNDKLAARSGGRRIGDSCYEVLHGLEAVCPWCVNDRVFQGETVRWEVKSPMDDRWYYVVNSPIHHADGSVSKQAMIMDITERKNAEEALRFTQFAVDHGADAAYWMEPDGRIVYVNEAACRGLGYTKDELMSMNAKDICAPVTEGWWAMHWRNIRDKGSFSFEWQHRRRDGSMYPVEISVNYIEFDGKEFGCAFVRDITERRRAEERLRESERRFRDLFDSMSSGVAVYRPTDDANNFVITDFNKAAERVDCVKRSEVIGQTVTQIFPGIIDFGLLDVFKRVARTGNPENHPVSWYSDGRIEGWRETFVYKLPTGEIVSIFDDVTARKIAEDGLSRLGAAVHAAAESIIVTDATGTILYVNPCFEKMTGFSADEAVGKTPAILNSGKHKTDFYREMWSTIRSGKTWRGQFTNRRKDGALFEEEAVISPVRNASGQIANFVAVKRDVTQERALESQLRHSQKMEAIGRLAGGIAHDFTNILVIILNSAQLLRRKLVSVPESHPFLDQIIEASERSSKLTGELLAFAHQRPMTFRTMDLNKAVLGVKEILTRTIGPRNRLTIDTCPYSLRVNIDSSQIEQVLLHLAVNANDAMTGNGFLTVQTTSIRITEVEAVQLQSTVEECERPFGDFALLSISDTGSGMSEEVRAHVFEPFFTTKGMARSSGLGLSIVYGIIRQHRGFISCHSVPGCGTTFKCFFPIVTPETEANQPETKPAASINGSENVLVVENNPLIRNIAVKTLQAHGYQVTEAEDGRQVIELLKANELNVDVLVTDIFMPEMDGRELAEKARSINPKLKVLYASGYPRVHLIERGILAETDEVVAKPITAGTLCAALRRLVDTTTE